MDIEETIQPDELLELNEVADEDGIEEVAAVEPIDQDEFPDTLDDEPGEETPLVKQLREKIKEDAREKAELRRRLDAPRVERTKKPDLWEDCEGDPDRFEESLLAWQANEAKADAQEVADTADQGRAADEWRQELSTYKANAAKLAKPDFDSAEAAVISAFTDAQQTTVVMAAKDPARLIYALGRSPNRLAQLAQITNPIKLAAAVAVMEKERMMPRKQPANIDSPMQGSARLSVASEDAEEKRLEKEAARTKDYTKLFAYRRQKRAKAA